MLLKSGSVTRPLDRGGKAGGWLTSHWAGPAYRRRLGPIFVHFQEFMRHEKDVRMISDFVHFRQKMSLKAVTVLPTAIFFYGSPHYFAFRIPGA